MGTLNMERQEGESDQDHLDRLNAMDTTSWSVDDVMARALHLRFAQQRMAVQSSGTPVTPEFLALLQQVRGLSDERRRCLARWIAQGMPPVDPASVTEAPRLRLHRNKARDAEVV